MTNSSMAHNSTMAGNSTMAPNPHTILRSALNSTEFVQLREWAVRPGRKLAIARNRTLPDAECPHFCRGVCAAGNQSQVGVFTMGHDNSSMASNSSMMGNSSQSAVTWVGATQNVSSLANTTYENLCVFLTTLQTRAV